jgi:predicted esterase
LTPKQTAGPLPLLIVLHGRNGDKEHHLERWAAACERGWLVLAPQSTQAVSCNSFCWDDPERALADVRYYYEQIRREVEIDNGKILIGGFSQGSGLAIHAALTGTVPARGFIGVATFLAEPSILTPLAAKNRELRGYFVTGGKDHTLGKAREIQAILKDHGLEYAEEMYPQLAHEFPPDFETSLEKARSFILKD